jgi:glycosyltransferase involved in cell wall biosynthesis
VRRVLICNSQVPFEYGGAEILVESLRDQLRQRGFEVDVVTMPFLWPTRTDLFKSALSWRLLDVREINRKRVDLVITTRFPSYLVKHPNKVVWLVHQLRQVYDLLGTQHSDFYPQEPRDERAVALIHEMDRRTLAEARALYTISANVAQRLQQHNKLTARVLYPPSKLSGSLRAGEMGDYVFSVGRLNPMKRFELLVRALAQTQTPVRCRIAGTGELREPLLALAAKLGVADRLELLGWVGDADLVAQYAGALAVYYAPYDEDYGFVTAEGFEAAKPVLTTADSGGVLELVEDGANGFVAPRDSARELAAAMDRLYRDRELARRLGAAGRARVQGITWDEVVDRLTA